MTPISIPSFNKRKYSQGSLVATGGEGSSYTI